MPKIEAKDAAPAPEGDFPITISEFCQRASATDKRVELLSAFYRANKDAAPALEIQFREALEKFANQPA